MVKRILVVDDDPLFEELIQGQLKQAGYEHLSFETPLQALAFFRQNYKGVDLAIIDLALPFIDGSELARKLREIAPGLPILLITGHVEAKNINGNISRVMYKPLTRDELVKAIEDLTGGPATGERKSAGQKPKP